MHPSQLSLAGDLPALFRHTRGLLEILADAANPRRASQAAAQSVAALDRALEAAPSPLPLACAKGCSYCCWNWVGATAPEIFLLADTLRRQAGDGRAALALRLREAAAASRDSDRAARVAGAHPCAVLMRDGESGVCGAYEARPLVCRATVSTALAACITAWQGGPDAIPAPRRFVELRGGYDQCLWAALRESGLSDTSYELNDALARLIDDESAERRWLAGEDVFAGITVDGTSDEATRSFGQVLIAGARRT